jgi:hypothetical protein
MTSGGRRARERAVRNNFVGEVVIIIIATQSCMQWFRN